MNHFEIADPMRSMKGYLQVVGMNIHLRAINSWKINKMSVHLW